VEFGMSIEQVLNRQVVVAKPVDDLTKAARLMREKHVGYLVVVEPDVEASDFRPIGVLTDRDIVVAVVAADADPRALTVGDVMTAKPVVISESASTAEAVTQMRRIGVRRLPVIGKHGQLVGIVSLDDILENFAAELQDLAGSIRNERRIEGTLRS
jgi:CBS domain-containing protein